MPVLIHLAQRFISKSEHAPSKTPYPPSKYHYLLHRFGELSIIVLGEFFIKLATSSADREFSSSSIFIGLCLLGISVSLWWLYFDHLEHASLAAASSRVGLWIYGHYPFLLAITAYGVVGNKIFASETGQALDDSKRILFTIALALALLAYGAIEWATKERGETLDRKPQPWVRIGGAAALLALGMLGSGLNVGLLVLLVVTIFVIQVGLDVYKRLSLAPG
jgi:low temperature requirement protein LtrA